MTDLDSTKERPHPTKERKHVPRTPQLARSNFLALYWDKPISELTANGHALPGIQERFLPENRLQTLGSFLSEGDPQLQTFADFKKQLASGRQDRLRKVISGFKTICPSPEELLKKNPDALNWVPWETYIAYGEILHAKKHGAKDEQVAHIVSGAPYIAQVQEAFPQGHPHKRTEIVLERQNKDPRTQGVLEAVSNAIDAISHREKIGQFGLGVKQILTWLEKGKGEATVLTKTAEGEMFCLKARLGFDNQVYIKYAAPTEEEQAQLDQHSTILTVRDIAVAPEKQQVLREKLQQQFQYVPETTITVNEQEISSTDRVTVIGRTTPISPQGQIDVTITDNQLRIADTGSGMDNQTLFKMFLPGYGKGYQPLSQREARTIAKEQAEVLLVEEDTPKMVFSRNREADFAIEIPTDRLNTSGKTICIELGRILKVSEGRDGFEIDDNFAAAIPILVEKTLRDEQLSDADKTTFLNSLTLGIEQLAGDTSSETTDQLATIVAQTKKGIREQAIPYLKNLQEREQLLLPNYQAYQKVSAEAQFIDPYLLEGVGDVASVLQTEGMTRLKAAAGINTKAGWKVFTTELQLTEGSQHMMQQLQHKESLAALRQTIDEQLPAIVDPQHRVAIIDQALWQQMEQEQDPIRKAYLQETIQTMLNKQIMTSYEEHDPREIAVGEKQKTSQRESHEAVLTEDEKDLLTSWMYPLLWNQGKFLYEIDQSGVMNCYEKASGEIVTTKRIAGMKGERFLDSCPTEEGLWTLDVKGTLCYIDHNATVREQHHVPNISKDRRNAISITPEGKVVYVEGGAIATYNPHTQEKQVYEIDGVGKRTKPYCVDEDHIAFVTNQKVTIMNTETGMSVQESKTFFDSPAVNPTFFAHQGELYLARFSPWRQTVSISQVTYDKQSVTTTPSTTSVMGDIDLSQFSIVTTSDAESVGIQTTNKVTYVTPSSREVTDIIRLPYKYIAKEYATHALHALKDLFGDDDETSYGEAVLALCKGLEQGSLTHAKPPKEPREREKQKAQEQELFQFEKGFIVEGKETAYHNMILQRKGNEQFSFQELADVLDALPEELQKVAKDLLRQNNVEGDKNPEEEKRPSFPASIIPWDLEETLSIDPSTKPNFGIPEANIPEKKNTSIQDERVAQLVERLQSASVRDAFAPVWRAIQESATPEERHHLKMRFVANSPRLLDLPAEQITPEILELSFFSDNPQHFFDEAPRQQKERTKITRDIDRITQKEDVISLLTMMVADKQPEQREQIYGQCGKIFGKEQFRTAFLTTIQDKNDSLAQAIAAPESLEITNPLRSYLLFITGNADLLRTKEAFASHDGYEAQLPPNIPLELLAYLRLTDGLTTVGEIQEWVAQEGGIEQILEEVDLSHYQDEIRKAIHAQSVEPGVAKRELLQNALYAMRAKGQDEGKITADFYLRNNGQEYVEEITDTGTGIENVLSFLVPGVTTKEASEGLGIFGTGFYKTLEDVDAIEVDSTTRGRAERIIIDLIKDDDGRVQRGVVRELAEKKVSTLTETGTSIKLIRNTQAQLPELDAMIAKNTYLTMGGLAAHPQVSEQEVQFYFVGESGETQPVSIPVRDVSYIPLESGNEIMFVKAPSLPSAMTSLGLRMSPLANVSSDYLADVPDVLKTFLTDEHISVVLPQDIPPVKDRSRIANEERYLPEIQRAIATEAIKRTAYALLQDTQTKIRGLLPEDILINQDYYKTLTSEAGERAYSIAKKISKGDILNDDDLAMLNTEGNANDLLLVLIGIEQTAANGKKDSLLRRFQYIQEKAGNTRVSQGIGTSLALDPREIAYSPQLRRDEYRLVPQARNNMQMNEEVSAVTNAIERGEKQPGITGLADTSMDESEKQLLQHYFSGIGFEEVYFVSSSQFSGEGVVSRGKLLLNRSLLNKSPRERWEKINHESSHVLANRAIGITQGVFDTEEEKKNRFTHQQEGPFADYYKVAARAMQTQLVR